MDNVVTECKTTEHGHRHNKHHHDHQHDCIFPFVYRGKTYHECTTDCLQRGEDHKGIKAWCDKTEMRPWCATKINKKDVMKDWELCGEGCPGTGEAEAGTCPELFEMSIVQSSSATRSLSSTRLGVACERVSASPARAVRAAEQWWTPGRGAAGSPPPPPAGTGSSCASVSVLRSRAGAAASPPPGPAWLLVGVSFRTCRTDT